MIAEGTRQQHERGADPHQVVHPRDVWNPRGGSSDRSRQCLKDESQQERADCDPQLEPRVGRQRRPDAPVEPVVSPRADAHASHESGHHGAHRERRPPEGESEHLRPGDLVDQRGRTGHEGKEVERARQQRLQGSEDRSNSVAFPFEPGRSWRPPRGSGRSATGVTQTGGHPCHIASMPLLLSNHRRCRSDPPAESRLGDFDDLDVPGVDGLECPGEPLQDRLLQGVDEALLEHASRVDQGDLPGGHRRVKLPDQLSPLGG